MKKFSIVVPIYNAEKYVEQMIESLCHQTLIDIEIILVDDGSPDNSGQICDKWAKKDNRIKVLHKQNEGVSAARNDGMSIACGEYIIFCDSDDWLPDNALEVLYEEANRTNADVVIGDVYLHREGKNSLARFYRESFVTDNRLFIDKMIQADIYRTYCPMPSDSGPAFGYGGPWNKAVRLDFLKSNNIKFDIRVKGIFDDIIFSAYILANAKVVSYITVPVYFYRLIPMSITRTFKANAIEINQAIFECWKEFIDAYDKNKLFATPFYAVVIRRFVEILPTYFFSEKNPKSFKEKLSEINLLINEEPYKSAIINVEYNKLTIYHKQIHKMMAFKSPFLIWILFKAKYLINMYIRKKI